MFGREKVLWPEVDAHGEDPCSVYMGFSSASNSTDHQVRPAHLQNCHCPNPVRFQIDLSKGANVDRSGWSIRQITSEFKTLGNCSPTIPNFFFSFVTCYLTHWAMIVQWPLPFIKHSSVQAIIRALTCVPVAVAMTTASAWSASYSWIDTWMTTSWISETHPSG